MFLPIFLAALLSFSLLSMTYVYLYRGQARYVDLSEYLRKGWPIFTPFNCMLYMFTKKRAKKAIMDVNDYPELKLLTENWEVIKKEGTALLEGKIFDKTTESDAQYDLGFRTFYKYGWSKFYLKWYGHTHKSALTLCPETVKLLKKCKTVNGAMFTTLPPGSQLTRHLDPVACSLRYHLGLETPNSDDCFISIDDQKYSWRDGEALIFDETYLHFAKNNSEKNRLILMCDVDRPMNFLGKIVNFFYKFALSFTVVPNMDGDKRGLVNTIFSSLSPVLKKSKNLKATNRGLYLCLKYTVNTVLICLLLLIILGVVKGIMILSQNF